MMQSFEEKRAYPRFPISLPVCCQNGNPASKIYARTRDISAIGLGIVADSEIPIGTNFDLYLEMLDNKERIQRKGEVVWLQKVEEGMFRIGIRVLEQKLKPIPIVLRTINFQRKY